MIFWGGGEGRLDKFILSARTLPRRSLQHGSSFVLSSTFKTQQLAAFEAVNRHPQDGEIAKGRQLTLSSNIRLAQKLAVLLFGSEERLGEPNNLVVTVMALSLGPVGLDLRHKDHWKIQNSFKFHPAASVTSKLPKHSKDRLGIRNRLPLGNQYS